MNNYIVYMHVSPSDKRYIGITCQTVSKRWQNGNGYRNNIHFTRAINKYGWDNFQHIIIAKGLTEDEAKWLEIELIRKWDSTNPNKGYNITLGGEGANGLVHTEEFKEKRSKKYSGEGNPFYGKQHSEETKEKLREINTGKTHSEETKRKISENHRDVSGENNPFYGKGYLQAGGNNPMAKRVICLDTMEIFDTVEEASRSVDGCYAIEKALNNKTPYKGKRFMYYDDFLENGEDQIKYKEREYDRDNPTKGRKVICLDTMEIFPSISLASESINCNEDALRSSINNHRKHKGYSFMDYEEYLEKGVIELREKKDVKGKNNGRAKKIICLETKEIFDTKKELCEKFEWSYTCFITCFKKDKMYKGYTFILYEDYILSMEM